jgi:uncharacterized protein (TIGR03437 family)
LIRFRITLIALLLAATLGAFSAAGQDISVLYGNGQVVCLGCLTRAGGAFQPLKVLVTDTTGAPQANVLVTWTTSGGQLQNLETITGPDGTSQNVLFTFNYLNSSAFQSFTQYTVTASTATATATFMETVGLPDPIRPGISYIQDPILVYPISVPIGGTLNGQIGSSATPIIINVTDEHGTPVPNVAVFLVNSQDATQGPVMQCAATPGAGLNTVLTDAKGTATCTPVFGGMPNRNGQFSVLVGGAYPGADPTQTPTGYWNSLGIGITATPGVPGKIVTTAGTNQSVNPGNSLPVALEVEVQAAGGSPLGAQDVRWTVSPAGAGTVGAATTTTDATGRTSNTFRASATSGGTVTVTATLAADSAKSTSFTVTVIPLITISGFQIVSGNNQSAAVNTAFAQPLVVQVTASGSPANIPVQFSASGPVSLSATTVSTDANGRAQVTATAGSITGAASVTATLASSTGTGTQTFSLTVLAPAPIISAANFVNGADNQADSLSACSIAAILAPAGTFPAQAGPTFPGLPLPSTNIGIAINGVSAPVQNLINMADGRQKLLFQVPCETAAAASAPATITAGGGTTNVNLKIQAASPGLFLTQMSDGVLRPLLIHSDGSYVSLANPARRGETLTALATGLGATAPSVGTNSVPAPGTTATVQGTVVVGMSGSGVPLVSAQRSEDLPGVYLVAFQIPASMATGNDVTFSIGVIPSGSSTPIYSNPARIPVQ